MRGMRRIQAKAFLLLAVFLSAGTSLPSLDGILFHGGDAGRAQTHVEPAGECLDHGQHCVLGRTAPGANAVVASAPEVRVALSSPPAVRSTTPSAFNSGIAGSPHSRAPPVPLA